MRSNICGAYIHHIQSGMYNVINQVSEAGPAGAVVGHLGVIPVTFIDYTLEVAGKLLRVIENTICLALNIFGISSSEAYSLHDAFDCLKNSAYMPIIFIKKSVWLIPHLFSNVCDPKQAHSISGWPKGTVLAKVWYTDVRGDLNGIA